MYARQNMPLRKVTLYLIRKAAYVAEWPQIRALLVYDPNMPDRLPPFLFARRLAVQAFHWQLFGLRALFVSSIWLALMPYMTVMVWRLFFWAGESL